MDNVTIKKMDKIGRFVIPMELRKKMGIDPDTRLLIGMENNKLIIQPLSSAAKSVVPEKM